MASSRKRFANTNKIIKQLLNSVLVGYEELLRFVLFVLLFSAFVLILKIQEYFKFSVWFSKFLIQ